VWGSVPHRPEPQSDHSPVGGGFSPSTTTTAINAHHQLRSHARAQQNALHELPDHSSSIYSLEDPKTKSSTPCSDYPPFVTVSGAFCQPDKQHQNPTPSLTVATPQVNPPAGPPIGAAPSAASA